MESEKMDRGGEWGRGPPFSSRAGEYLTLSKVSLYFPIPITHTPTHRLATRWWGLASVHLSPLWFAGVVYRWTPYPFAGVLLY